MDIVTILATLFSCIILLSVVELIRRNRLKEKYSLLWLVSSLVILLFSGSRDLLKNASYFFGIYYPPSFIFLLAFLFLTVINIHFSMVISELFEKNKNLTQEIAIMKKAVKEAQRE